MRKIQGLAGALCLSMAAGALFAGVAAAQEWPSKPVRMVVPFPPGAPDAVTRLLSQRLSTKFGQPFVVDNRPGAGGNIGTDIGAKAAPDGYTYVLSASGPLTNNKILYKSLPYDPMKDFTPIILVGDIPLVIAVNANSPARNLKEFVEMARAKPGTLNVGSPGAGTNSHLALELFKSVAKIDLQHVPYKGAVPAMTDLLGGQVHAVSAFISDYIRPIQAGRVRALAVTTRTRFDLLPDVPTAIEQGIDIDASGWLAVMGPAGVPRAIVDKMNHEMNLYLTSSEGRSKMAELGIQVIGGTPDRARAMMEADLAKWTPIIQARGIKLD
jgi:tripartite-type tricarboxylate transporter receptor subunit TctC